MSLIASTSTPIDVIFHFQTQSFSERRKNMLKDVFIASSHVILE